MRLTQIPKMARLIVALLLGTATTALQQPNIRPRAPTAKNAVPCAEADALMAQARHLREMAEIEERQLRALRAEAKPQAVEGKNNILPLERLKAWSRAVSFEAPSPSRTLAQAHAPLLRGQQGRISCLDEVSGRR